MWSGGADLEIGGPAVRGIIEGGGGWFGRAVPIWRSAVRRSGGPAGRGASGGVALGQRGRRVVTEAAAGAGSGRAVPAESGREPAAPAARGAVVNGQSNVFRSSVTA